MDIQQWMGLTLLPFALLGLICNWMIVYVIWKSRNFTQSFVALTANQSFFEACHSTIYLFYVFPMIFFNSSLLKESSYHIGYLILICYDSSMQIHFIMTINRIFAVFTPFLYSKIFSPKNTRRVLVTSFLVSFFVITLFFRFLGCTMTYLDEMWMFEYSQQPICISYMNINDLGKITTFAILNVVLDTITIMRLNYKKRKMQKSRNTSSTIFNKKEVDFLKQTYIQGIAVFLGLSVFIFAPELVTDPIRAFILSSLFWCFLHAFDGLITIMYNSDVQGYIRKVLLKHKTVMVPSSGLKF